ncbi:TPA: preprotein translocase subunit SecB [Vibrio alginolyticus]|uniref:hypothetical protein n=1 Tax=Psychromonas arctica TaxID=168275 RepID=UPI00048C20DD|nr:hypothetical protein [Psychromonas arctica]
MINTNLQKAIECLRISDLYVRNLESKCNEGFDPKHSDMEDLIIQTKHMVTKSEILQSDEEEKLFRVCVEVGVRWAREAKDTSNPLLFIEAEFVAEYSVTDDLPEECFNEFALKNVSYHVWPYWRELLTSQCDRMRMPRLLLPMTQVAHNSGHGEKINN